MGKFGDQYLTLRQQRQAFIPAAAAAVPTPVSLPRKEREEQKTVSAAKQETTSTHMPAVVPLPIRQRETYQPTAASNRFQALPSVEGMSERDALRQESRLRTQLVNGVSPEELGAREELREQRLQNISAAELKARQEQAVGHLKEAERAIALRETMSDVMRGETAVTGGIPITGERSAEEKALHRERDKWQGIVNDLSSRYYYRENEEKAVALAGDRAGQSRVQAVEDILADLRVLGEVATGQYEDQRDREALMARYGLSERELEGQAPALIQRLQGELERAKEEAKAAGYDYDRMTGYQERKAQALRAAEGQRHTEEFAEEHPMLASAASVLAGPAQGLDYFTQLAKGYGHSDTEKLESYVPANVYEMRATNFVRNIRGTVARGLEEKYGWSVGGQNVASFLYQTGMSMGDFLFNAMLTGNFSGGLGGTGSELGQKAASDLSLAIMGSGAAANTTAEAIERGLSNRQAYTLGAIAGVAEIITEKVSLETLLDKTALDRSARGYLLKNILAEGSEEIASDLINWAGDVLVARDRSQWNQAIQEYMAQGMGEKEAFELALKDQLISMAWSGVGGGLSGGVMAGARVALNGIQQQGTGVSQEQKTASGKRIGEYHVEQPVNVENPTVPIIDISLNELAALNGGRVPKQGGYIRDTVIERAKKRLGLDQNEAAYIPASNISRGGEEYVLKVTKATLNKMFSPADGSAVPLETAAAVEHLEQIANNAVWYKGEGDRKGRVQIRGVDHLLTTVYIDSVPTVIDMTVRITQQTSQGETYNVLYYLEPEAIAITGEKGSGATSAAERHAFRGEMSPLHEKTISQKEERVNIKERSPAESRADGTIDPSLTSKTSSGQTPLTDTILPQEGKDVKSQFAQEGADYTGKQRPVLLPVAERQAPKLLPVAGETMMTEEDWGSLMESDTGREARRDAAAKPQSGKENPFIQTGTQGEFVDDRTAREKAMVEEARRRKAAQPAGAEPIYRMTSAMEKLGMEAPSRPITDTGMSESLRANEKALYEARRALDKVLRDTHADERARRVAKGIVDGIYSFADADKMGLDRRAMVDIVEAMELERSFNGKNIKAHQERTNWVFDGKVQELIKDAGNWKAPSLVSMNASTMQRTVERMMDPATAKAVNAEFFDPVLENEAKRIRFVNRQLDGVREYQLTTAESGVVQRLMEGKVTVDELRGEGYDVSRISKAAKTISEMYATLYDAINDFLVVHGYEEIGWQRNYAPHMQEENLTKLQKYLQRLGFSVEVTELPTEIAGRTDAFRPGKQYDPFFQHRAGGERNIKYDAVGGLESYINYLSNVLYHTDDIQKLRRLNEGIREKYADEYIRGELDRLNDLQDQIVSGKMDGAKWEDMQAQKDKLYEELGKKSKLGGFVSVLEDYTNILAGKQSKLDRAIESFAGRRVLNWGRNIQNAFARSAVMGNLSSAINQTVQLPQLTAEVGPQYVLQAIADVASGKVGRTGFDKESTFLTGKQGVQAVSALEGMEVLYNKLSIPFEVVDDLASRIIVRAKYLQQVAQGLDHTTALKAADQYANRLVGSRMKGAKPILFEQKNPITKLVTTFQLEVANGWEHIFHDLPMEIQETARTQGKAAAVGKTVKLMVGAEVAAFLANLLIKGITGREPVPFDGIGMLVNYMASGYGMTKEDYMKAALTGEEMPGKFDVPAALGDAAEGVMDNVPFLSNATTLLGITDGRLPLPQIETEKLGGAVKDAITAVTSEDEEERKAAGERVLPQTVEGVAGTVASFLPAGNQLKKTFRALPILEKGGAYTGAGEEEKLKYPVEQSLANWAKGLMFGTSALPETDAYYAEGKKTLTAKETRVYETLVEAGSDGQKVYDTMQELKGAKERKGKVDVLLAYDGTREEKEALFSGMVTQTLDEELEELAKLGIPFDTVLEAYKAQYGLEGDKDPKTGETVPLSLAKKKKNAVDRVLSGLTQEQREAVYKAMGISEKVWNQPRLPPVRK